MNVPRETVNNDTVRQILRTRGITQSALSTLLGFAHQSSVGNKLAGRVEWSASEVALLARLCGVPMETFFRPITIDIRPSANVDVDIPGYHNQGLSPGVRVLKRVA
jgi:hypothetical protein